MPVPLELDPGRHEPGSPYYEEPPSEEEVERWIQRQEDRGEL